MCKICKTILFIGTSSLHLIYMQNTTRTVIRVMITTWLAGTLVLVYAYSGVKTSLMAVPHWQPTFNTLEEVIASNRFSIISEMGVSLTGQFLVQKIYSPYIVCHVIVSYHLPETLSIIGSYQRDLQNHR